MNIDMNIDMAAELIALANTHAGNLPADLGENFTKAIRYAEHMIKGGSYNGRERAVVHTQLTQLKRHFPQYA